MKVYREIAYILVICTLTAWLVLVAGALKTCREEYAKANLIEPTPKWVGLHGNDLQSWQTYNLNLLITEARTKQLQAAEAPK